MANENEHLGVLASLQTVVREHVCWLKSGGASGKRANLRGANLVQIDLRGANFERTLMKGASLLGASLEMAWLRNVDLSDVLFERVHINRTYH